MHSHPVRTLLVLVALGLIGSVSGQRPEDGEVAFEKKIRNSRNLREQLRKGDVSANVKDKEQVEAIEDTARMIVYPLYWRTLNKPVGKVNEVVDDFASKLSEYQRARPNTNAFIQLLCKEVIDRCVEIIKHRSGKPIAGINAARILATIPGRRSPGGSPVAEKMWIEETGPRLAEGNAELLAETCLNLLADAKSTDGHRYYYYRCLASLLSLPPSSPPLLKPDTIDRILQKANEQVEKKVVFPKATPRQEVEGYKMLRQQAVIILAAGRKPIVGDKNRPVFTLARVAGADSDLAPAPRLTERVEAAIGLARLGAASGKLADIQTDYAAGAIVAAVIEFGKQANANLNNKAVDRLQPWRVEAARLSEALDELKLAVKTPYVQSAIKECQGKVLGDIERNQLCEAGKLADWATNNLPPSKSLFKSDPTSTIKGAAAAPE